MILYLLTVICQQKLKFVCKRDLDSVLLWLKMNISSLKVYQSCYERSGVYSQLHFHGIVSTSSYFRWKPYIQYGDTEVNNCTFRVHWSRIHDYEGAVSYVYKDTHNCDVKQSQIFNENIFKYHYFNMDSQTYDLNSNLRASLASRGFSP